MAVVPLESKPKGQRAPGHLRPATQAWFRNVCAEWELSEHHVRLLTIAAEAWDQAQAAREVISQEGSTYNDRFGAPHARPEVKVQHDAKNTYMRALRELDLDLQEPPPPAGRRPPSLRSNRRP